MKTAFRIIKALGWGILSGFIVFSIVSGMTDWYTESLKQTGGIVTAETLLHLKTLPIMLAIIIAIAVFCYSCEEYKK